MSYRDQGLIPPPTDNYTVTSTTLVLTNPAYSATIGIGHSPGTTFTRFSSGGSGSGGATSTGDNTGGGSSGHGGSNLGGAAGAATNVCRTKSDCSDLGVLWSCFGPYQPLLFGPVKQLGAVCTSNSQCGLGSVCRTSSSADAGGGSSGLVCTDAACTDDSQCSNGQVCRNDPTMRPGELAPDGVVCSPPCTSDFDCSPTNQCDSAGHCRARSCAGCPSFFSCTSGTCIIPSCSTDSDCPGGYCINASCAGSLGVCRQQSS